MELFLQVVTAASEASSKSCHNSKMELFPKIAKNEKPFSIFAKTAIVDVWQGSKYVSELAFKVKDVFLFFFHVLQVTDNLLLGKNKRKQPTELQNN